MLLSILTNMRIACLDIAKTMKSNQLLCGRGIPCKDEGFERENSLTPILLTIFIFYNLCVPKHYGTGMLKMHGDMFCMHRILHIGKSSGNYTFTMNH